MKDRSPEYAGNTVSLSDCGVSLDIATLKSIFVEAFRRHMGGETNLDCLSADEQYTAQELSLKKYASDRWNLQGDVE
jgi:lipoate-protein ligase A